MVLEKFIIQFDNPHKVFYAGQNVSGKLIVSCDTPKKARGINIRFKGQASVRFTVKSGKSSTTYTSRETYFESTFAANYDGGDEQLISPGEHVFPFNYVLPNNLPSSFEGTFGQVRYSVKAVIDRPWKFDHETKAAFTVISPLDLNNDQKAIQPARQENSKTFCCASGSINAVVSLPSGGAVSGETLWPTLRVKNNSRASIWEIKLKFIKNVTYKAQGKKKMDFKTIAKKELGPVSAGQSLTFDREAVQIPSLPPSNLKHCDIIDLEYSLEAHFKLSGLHCNFDVCVPIVIGTIPLQQNFSQFAPGVPNQPVGWNILPSAPALDQPPLYPDLPPPTYEESVFGTQNVAEDEDSKYMHGDKNFAPMYPVYSLLKL